MSLPIASRSAFGVLFTTVFLDFLGFAIVLPYLFFLAQSFGATPFTYGLLVASYSLMQFVFTPILGQLSDRYGRRRIILLSLFGAGLSYFLFGIASALWLLFAARIIAGATESTLSVAQAYVADVTTKEDRLKYMGLLGAGVGLGLIFGPALGGTLSSLYGYAVPSFIASALAFSNLAAAFFRLPEPSRDRVARSKRLGFSSFKNAFGRKELSLLLSLYFAAILAFVFESVTATPWLQAMFGYGPFQTGLVFFYIGIVYALTQAVLIPKLSKRYTTASLALMGLLAISIGYAILGSFPSVAVLLLMGGLLSFGDGLMNATLNTLISLNAEAESQGSTLGVAQSLNGLAQTIAPGIATLIFTLGTSIGLNGLAFISAAIINSIALPLLFVFRTRRYPGTFRIVPRGLDDVNRELKPAVREQES